MLWSSFCISATSEIQLHFFLEVFVIHVITFHMFATRFVQAIHVFSVCFIVWSIYYSTVFVLGHGMIVEEPMESHDHWGRRLMSSESDNDTVEKNCTAPGESVPNLSFVPFIGIVQRCDIETRPTSFTSLWMDGQPLLLRRNISETQLWSLLNLVDVQKK